jgi:hypothetical protein
MLALDAPEFHKASLSQLPSVHHVESLLLSLPVSLSSLELGRRALALVDNPEGRDLTVDAVVDPEWDDKKLLEESVPKLPTVPLPEVDTAFNVDDGTKEIVSVRVESPLGLQKVWM